MNEYSEAVVINEEIIVHPTVTRKGKTWRGEARIMGKVVINGQTFSFERVVPVSFVHGHKVGDKQ